MYCVLCVCVCVYRALWVLSGVGVGGWEKRVMGLQQSVIGCDGDGKGLLGLSLVLLTQWREVG